IMQRLEVVPWSMAAMNCSDGDWLMADAPSRRSEACPVTFARAFRLPRSYCRPSVTTTDSCSRANRSEVAPPGTVTRRHDWFVCDVLHARHLKPELQGQTREAVPDEVDAKESR
ncbi:MAG: hypothetical protein ACXVGI_09305, partial [Mycobacteriaceae bacterium]